MTPAAAAWAGAAGHRIDQALGPWPVERQLLPPGYVIYQPAAAREAPRPAWRLLCTLIGRDRLPPATRRIALRVVLLLKHGAHAMTGITRMFDPATIDLGDDPWEVPSFPCIDQKDRPAESPDPSVAFRQPLLDVDALPAFQPGDPTAGSFWIHLHQGVTPALQARTAALDAAPAAAWADAPRATRLVMHSTMLSFLAAIVMVPAGCSFAAATAYGRSRDGPPRQAR